LFFHPTLLFSSKSLLFRIILPPHHQYSNLTCSKRFMDFFDPPPPPPPLFSPVSSLFFLDFSQGKVDLVCVSKARDPVRRSLFFCQRSGPFSLSQLKYLPFDPTYGGGVISPPSPSLVGRRDQRPSVLFRASKPSDFNIRRPLIRRENKSPQFLGPTPNFPFPTFPRTAAVPVVFRGCSYFGSSSFDGRGGDLHACRRRAS